MKNEPQLRCVSYVIISHAGAFWDGQGWTREYPDAQEYKTRAAADRAQRKAAANNPRAYVVKDYGMDSEEALP